MLPKMIKDGIISIDGIGYAGRCTNIQLPKLTRKTEELLAGGMSGPVEIDMSSEKLEMEFELYEHSPVVLAQYGICDSAGVGIRINASAEADDEDCSNAAIEIYGRGRWRELDFGSLKKGDTNMLKVSVALSSYRYSLNNVPIIYIDHANNKEIVGGVDRLKQRRQNLKM